ncbi:antibiotic biosynthesis monooxygenase [Dysgonomonas sp. 216]|uniref:putative quinol monooxygenase n=1 Tax=Dysgonomonas sp. 216 TaxID=2302934 RepID=UPI0013D8B7FF|nr:putative quinol monooxygenase [Dysgonomonas sp. 216]NDW17587.1 antibiotic biosynthesis monooxygenase [Dysgonomonas sp. 216]
MSELKIVATVIVKKEFQDELEKAFKAVVDGTRKEAGNISYDLHQDANNPLKYVILEVWKSQDAIDSHNVSDHFETFKNAIDGKIESLTIDVIKKVY